MPGDLEGGNIAPGRRLEATASQPALLKPRARRKSDSESIRETTFSNEEKVGSFFVGIKWLEILIFFVKLNSFVF